MQLTSTKSLILLSSTAALLVSIERLPQTKMANSAIIAANWLANELTIQPVNAQAANPVKSEIIKIKIQDNNSVSEWIRAEVIGNQVKLMHSRTTPGTLSKLVGFLGVPPVDRRWFDHPVSRTVFEPDNCPQSSLAQPSASNSCQIIGNGTIVLPEGTDIRQGRFTIEYTESDFTRSLSFRIPPKG